MVPILGVRVFFLVIFFNLLYFYWNECLVVHALVVCCGDESIVTSCEGFWWFAKRMVNIYFYSSLIIQ